MVADAGASLVETHSAVVVSIGDRVYKLKKPLNLGFLDFSTVEARRRACHREVELNRRLAPDVYLGVADVVDPAGLLCDHLVVMRRMPADRRLTACIERGEDVTEALRQVAHDVAALHERSPDAGAFAAVATRDAVRRLWDAGFDQMARDVGPVLHAATATRIEYLVHGYLDGRDELFETR
jgi:aminoglycoside phosphotransferase family enzyme